MTGSKGDLPDANVWLALTTAGHVHHAAAQTWVAGRTAVPLIFCRVTQMAVLRLLTTPAVMGADVCTQKEAWRIYDAALARPGSDFFPNHRRSSRCGGRGPVSTGPPQNYGRISTYRRSPMVMVSGW